jgi:hypothetical protein
MPRRSVSLEELIVLRSEEEVARGMKLPWQQRGPPPEALPEGMTTWRGQAYRPQSGKWANRGGAHKQWYTDFYQAKKAGPEALAKFLKDNPHPKAGAR